MFLRKNKQSQLKQCSQPKKDVSSDFWNEYEEKTGEKILSRGLGKYISGWDEFDEKKWSGLWGLIITTSGGFRFHHFPQNSWIDVLTRFADAEPVKEKTIFIPHDKITSSELKKETVWFKKLFAPPPRLIIKYKDETSSDSPCDEKKLVFEAEWSNGE